MKTDAQHLCGHGTLTLLLLLAPAARSEILLVPGDHATLQAAVDAAGPGDEVVVHGGVHEGQLTVLGKQALTLRGVGRPVLRAGYASEDTSALRLVGSSDVEIEGFLFERSSCGVSAQQHSGDLVVRDSRIVNCGAGIVITFMQAGSRSTVEDCRFEDLLGTAIRSQYVHADSRISVRGCLLRRAGASWSGSILLQGGAGHEIIENRFESSDSIGVGYATSVTIESNRLVRPLGGIRLDSCSASTISENTITDFAGTAITSRDAVSVEIAGNVIRRGRGDAIETSSTDVGVVVSGNRVDGATGKALAIEGDEGVVSGNTIVRSGWTGIALFRAEGSLVAGNHVRRSARVGLELEHFVSGVTVSGNTVRGSAAADFHDGSTGSNVVTADNSFGSVGP